MPFLKLKTAEIYYEVAGETGAWLTFVCGLTRTLADFKNYSRRFVAEGYRVLLFDNRGAGQTKWNPDFSIEEMTEDIQALWDHLKISQSILIGFSLGGQIAIQSAMRFSNRIRAMVLISSSIYPEYVNTQVLRDMEGTDEQLEACIRLFFSEKYRDKHLLFISAFAKKIIREHYRSEVEQGAVAQRKALQAAQGKAELSHLYVPVLLAHGTEDFIVKVESSRRAHAEMPHSQFTEFEHAGHMLLVEEPEKLFSLILDFLNHVSRLAVQ